MKKTINELNEKWWYGLIKILFILFFLFIFIGYNYFIFTEIDTRNINPDKTMIICNRPAAAKEHSFSLSNTGLNLDKNYFINGKLDYKYFFDINDEYKFKEIVKNCYFFSKDKQTIANTIKGIDDFYLDQKKLEIQNKYDVWRSGENDFINTDGKILDKATTDKLFMSMDKEMSSYNKFTEGIYDGKEKSNFLDFSATFFDIKPVFTYIEFIKFLFIGNLAIILSAYIIRGIFYYIVFGKIRPPKI